MTDAAGPRTRTVADVMSSPAITATSRESLAEAADRMSQHRLGSVVVVEDRRPVGILTERDLLRRVLAVGKPLTLAVAECMTSSPEVVHRKEPISAAVRRMEEGGYRHLPVVDEAGHLVGVLSVKRIIHYLVEHFPSTVYNLPPDPGIVQQEREGA